MSVSSKNINIFNAFNHKEKDETQNAFPRKMKKQISLQNDHYQKEIFNKLNEGSVLNYVTNSRRNSVKTNYSELSKEMKYDLCMINKYDESLNASLSFISEFDLEEEDDENDNNSSFNSLDNDDSVEQVEIKNKNNEKISILEDDEEHKTKLEKEWEDIQDLLLNKNSS